MSPSFNHSYLQAKLVAELLNTKKYTVLSELSLEIDNKEYRPDICLYSPRKANFLQDIARMQEMPLLAVEILSMSQTVQEATDKFEIYFKAGIKVCWLVMPIPSSITIFKNTDGLTTAETYSKGELYDTSLDIKISLDVLFDVSLPS